MTPTLAPKKHGMYRGKLMFDREQLIFMVELSLVAAFDRIESILPPVNSVEDYKVNKPLIDYCINGASHTVAVFVSVLWAQTEGQRVYDGMGTTDWAGYDQWEAMVEKYVKKATGKKCPKDLVKPNCRKFAKQIVDENWKNYLRYFDVQQEFPGLTSEGYECDDGGVYEWPDENGTIRYRDRHGNVEAVYEMPEEFNPKNQEHVEWKKLRDTFPDDALYFQPEGAGDHDDDDLPKSVRKIKSFDVYRDYETAVKAHPKGNIRGHRGSDIENMRFLDVKEPSLYFNDDEKN